MLDTEQYVEANKIGCAILCIRNYLWKNKSFEETLNLLTTPDRYTPHIWDSELTLAVKNELQKASNDIEYLKKILNTDRKAYVSPSYKNLKEYIKNNLETNKSIYEIQKVIQDNLLSLQENDYNKSAIENSLDKNEPDIDDDFDI